MEKKRDLLQMMKLAEDGKQKYIQSQIDTIDSQLSNLIAKENWDKTMSSFECLSGTDGSVNINGI